MRSDTGAIRYPSHAMLIIVTGLIFLGYLSTRRCSPMRGHLA